MEKISDIQKRLAANPDAKYRFTALARRVLAVLSVGPDGWRIYVDAVPGKNHSLEWMNVATGGIKQDERVARAILETHFCVEPDAPYVR